MMKKKLFISYADADKSKVRVIEKELINNPHFEPLIIANRRNPLKALTKKVSEGIEESEIVIPILTKESIKQQWINQEIGYSMGIKKKVIPIVESLIMGKLKGFIHKESDLSYNFRRHKNLGQENKNFKKSFLTLLEDLESKYRKEALNEELSETAIQLLTEIATNNEGTLLIAESMDGFSIVTKRKSFDDNKNVRIRAKLESAINQLFDKDFITERGESGNYFGITDEGFYYYDKFIS